jgi:phosphatidylglycerol:prolipoprotein diacylglycerol transferase
MFDAVKVTEGGLVIYGGVIGGLVAGWIFCRRHRLPMLATADLVAPGFLIGLSLGRIGCLLHGCCFGGVCQAELPTIAFPHGSVPFQAQVLDGSLLGLELSDRQLPTQVESVTPSSLADSREIKPGMIVTGIFSSQLAEEGADPVSPPRIVAEVQTRDQRFLFMPDDLPERSLAVHPSQIYASINALLLTLLVWFMQPLTKQDGVVFCSAVLLYAVTRCLLEWVRSDEAGQLGTGLTIAQLVAVATALVAIAGLLWLKRANHPRVWQARWSAISE